MLTRPAGRNEALAERLRGLGHAVVICPLVEIEPIEGGPIDLTPFDWVVLTSATGARALRGRAVGEARRVAAIGATTAAAWAGQVDLVPAVATQEGLLAELPRPAGRVLFAAAEGARRLLAEQLEAEFVPLYRTKAMRPERPPDGDLVVLASPSAARSLAGLGAAPPTVTIGPETTAAARELGLRVVAEARTPDTDGLAEAVLAAAS